MAKQDQLGEPERKSEETPEQKAMSEQLQKMALEAEYGKGTPLSVEEAEVVKQAQVEENERLEKQPVWKEIRELQASSKFERSDKNSANCTIEFEGKKYKIETVESSEDPRIDKVCRLLKKTFGPEEVDPPSMTREAVDGYSPDWDVHYPKYRIITVSDERGRLVHTFTGAQLDLLNKEGKSTGEVCYSGGYSVTAENCRLKGLGREAYISALIDAQNEAQKGERKLAFSIGECTYTSENHWNRVGWARVYNKDLEGNCSELRYIQPALDFDEKTGKPTEDAGEAPEHLMLHYFKEGNPTIEDIRNGYEALIHYNVDWPPSAFETSEAYQAHVDYCERAKKDFYKQLEASNNLVFMTASERATAKKQGIKVEGHTAADHGDAGNEDF